MTHPTFPQDEVTATVWELVSYNLGVSWSEPSLLFSNAGTFDRNKIFVDGNNLIFPLYHVALSSSDCYSFMAISYDHGNTWKNVT
ncbi:MAG: hypothetical protein Satyrvirus16_16, partial [Satyrvirus sp.]